MHRVIASLLILVLASFALAPPLPQLTQRTCLSIQYPGGVHGRFNPASEPVAPEIVALAHRLGFDTIGHWQPEGGASVSSLQLASPYTPLADSFMRPTSLLVDVSPNFTEAWSLATRLKMKNMWYEGAASVINLGTPDNPVLRWVSPDDAPLLHRRTATICRRFSPDYLFIDDINKLGAYMGMPTNTNWSNPPDGPDFRVRTGDPPMRRYKNMLPAFHSAVSSAVPPSTVLGYEPRTDNFWTDEQLGKPPWMQIVELADLPNFPNATRPNCFLVLNSLSANYTVADIRRWIALTHAKGYDAIVTWWVLKVALIRDGHNIDALLTESISLLAPLTLDHDAANDHLNSLLEYRPDPAKVLQYFNEHPEAQAVHISDFRRWEEESRQRTVDRLKATGDEG